jgi:hypothetical protein
MIWSASVGGAVALAAAVALTERPPLIDQRQVRHGVDRPLSCADLAHRSASRPAPLRRRWRTCATRVRCLPNWAWARSSPTRNRLANGVLKVERWSRRGIGRSGPSATSVRRAHDRGTWPKSASRSLRRQLPRRTHRPSLKTRLTSTVAGGRQRSRFTE